QCVNSSVEEQNRSRAGGPWSGRRAENTPRRHGSLQQLIREVLAYEIRRGHGQPPQQSISVAAAKSAEPSARFEEIPELSAGGIIERRWSDLEHRRKKLGQRLERVAEGRICRG